VQTDRSFHITGREPPETVVCHSKSRRLSDISAYETDWLS
jgi:hypothetical protein